MREERQQNLTTERSRRITRESFLLSSLFLLSSFPLREKSHSQNTQQKPETQSQKETGSVVFMELIDQGSKDLTEKGYFSRAYSESEFAELVQNVANYLLQTEQDIVNMKIDPLHVAIQETNARIEGKAKVKKVYFEKDIEFSCILSNGDAPNTLRIDSLDYSHKEFIDQIIKLAGKKDLFDMLLQNPNQAVVKTLNRLYKTQDVTVTKADLSFLDKSLAMTLYGNPKVS